MNKLKRKRLKGWTFQYHQNDMGTERVLTVRDQDGLLVGHFDPCWNSPMPWSFKDHADKIKWLRQRAAEMVSA